MFLCYSHQMPGMNMYVFEPSEMYIVEHLLNGIPSVNHTCCYCLCTTDGLFIKAITATDQINRIDKMQSFSRVMV